MAEEAQRKTSVKDLAERFGGSVQSRASASMLKSAPKDSGFKLCNGIHVSAQDDREYRALTLPNRLEVLLIHDANTDKGSAALDVNVGHFKDPAEFPGLAHSVLKSVTSSIQSMGLSPNMLLRNLFEDAHAHSLSCTANPG